MIKKIIISILFISISLCANSAALPPVKAKHGMVVTSQHLATQVGVNILKQGGNAIDAAVAVGFALAVVEPCCGNIGGGGFMLIRFVSGKNTFINFREKAPMNLRASMLFNPDGSLNKKKLNNSYLSAGVPGTVMGLTYALKKYGTMSLQQVMQPAIKLAQQGFILNPQIVATMNKYGYKYFKNEPNVAKIFLNNGKPYQAYERLLQPELAKTLSLIENKGAKVFYQGKIAKAIVKASEKNGGVFTLKDFKDYTVQELNPIICHYRGYKIITAPPPSGGGVTLCQMLEILQAYPLDFLGFHSSTSIHYQVEAMRYAFADRAYFLGDPDFVTNPIKRLLSKKHIDNIAKQIQAFHASDSNKVSPKIATSQEKMETTHYSIVDKYGNAVAVTYTINHFFGNNLIAGNTGFFLNDELSDFSLTNKTKLKKVPNAFAPGKRPLSSMAPTIITLDKKLYMVIGTPGGKTIPTQILQVVQNVIDYHMDIREAIVVPRFHMQWFPDKIFVEPFAFSNDTIQKLEYMGYDLQLNSLYGRKYWSSVQAILRDPKTGLLYGASDPRRPAGAALGF